MRIPESTLSEIQGKLDLAEVIGEYVHLQKKGNRYWGLCPFHQEKTPSFSVTPEKGIFYCFGCQKGGGLIQFVMDVERLSFLEAVEVLARKAGVQIERQEEEQGGIKRETFLELYRRVAGSFRWLLEESPMAAAARAYLESRGVTTESREKFQLGYAPADRDWLRRFLLQKSYSEEFLGKTGLFSQASGGRSALFANRIIFPIANARGEILAFGGRALGDGAPKYLNSPETAFFRKGENLFGIDKAGQAMRTADTGVIVEGYMDALAMHQAGVDHCVAPLGTALTAEQVKLLRRFASRVVLVFDGDEAGEKATLRALETLEAQDTPARVVEVTGGKDPAEVLQKDGPQAVQALVAGARESFPYLVEKALGRFDARGVEGKEKVCDFLFPFAAAAVSQVRAEEYLRGIADAVGAEGRAVSADFAAWRRGRQRGPEQARAAERPREESGPLPHDLFLMLVVAAHQELFPVVRNGGIAMGDLEDPRARDLYVALEEAFRAEETAFDALCARLEDASLRETLIRKVASGEFDVNQDRMVAESIKRIKQRTLARKRDAVIAELRRLEREKPDAARVRELLTEKMHLDGELSRLDPRSAGDDRQHMGART
jgi:DNA primase